MDAVFIYPSTSAKLLMHRRLEVIANNLANADTNGYKKEYPVFGSVTPPFSKIGSMTESKDGTGGTSVIPIPVFAMLSELTINFKQGEIKTTDAPLDVAIEGRGFFQIQTPSGVRYTRDGSFIMSPEGELVTDSGMPVLGIGGTMTLPPGVVYISDTGKISVKEKGVAAPTEVDSFALVDFEDTSLLQKVGDDLFALMEGDAIPMEEGTARIRQGAVEGSNVNPVEEMIHMIFAIRQYEAAQKAIQTAEEIDVNKVNKVGQLRP